MLGYAIALIADFDRGAAGLQYVTDDNWISELGIRYQLGVDGLNLFLVALTALLWVPATIWGALRTTDRPKLFMFHMALAETAVLGAFMAQDLALFVVFFDLMLVPFYFLIGGWGEGDRVRATTKFTIYTLVGSLLMLAGAIALGVLSADGGDVSFSFAVLEERTLGEGTQQWIFLLFAAGVPREGAAVPVPRLGGGHLPLHARCPVLVVLSAVLSKVGVYGFLRIVLPILPDASQHFQDLMLVLAVFSILYGSVARLLPGRAAAGGGLLLDRPARLHRARHLLPGRQGRPGRADADGEPRPGGGAAVLHHRAAHRARRRLAVAGADGRHGAARARARGVLPDRHAGHAGDARARRTSSARS